MGFATNRTSSRFSATGVNPKRIRSEEIHKWMKIRNDLRFGVSGMQRNVTHELIIMEKWGSRTVNENPTRDLARLIIV